MASEQLLEFKKQIGTLKSTLEQSKTLSNTKKRIMYSKAELFRSYIKKSGIEENIASSLEAQLDSIISVLNLQYLQSNTYWYDFLDEWVRLVVVWEILVTSAVVLSIPMITLRLVDFIFVDLGLGSPYSFASVLFKKIICKSILYTSGVIMHVEGEEHFKDDYGCSLACFSHASTLDAFLLAAAIPVVTCSLAKKELFLVPFFSWLMFAFGAVPVDRKNRKAAVTSLNIAASSGDCVTIAPEGTRSTTGQLLAFKKGPFHIWEQLQVPIVPIVIMGAYEMQPPGNNMAVPGLVYVKFLPPIEPSDAKDRDAMSELVRTRMLECLLTTPADTCRPLNSSEKLLCRGTLVASAITCSSILWGLYSFVTSKASEASTKEVAMWSLGVTVGGTLVSYVYCVYIQRWSYNFVQWTKRNIFTGSSSAKKNA